ncbi:transmembrane and TPR repeat-containing protein CG31690 [Copidosoma floridanum]|uniref:transmembrane and TPR repeat-containing protein CG31690 n=1 Tax=Copidosoma floridanum TaxID=29053 RepID=UPI0006C9D943|nr:transmembrane and TPR repeat-containing protein CG31690 [Copidosoma floridanum]
MDVLDVVCALLAVALYYNTLHAGFVYDDRRAILTNGDLRPGAPWSRLLENDFWGTPLRERGSHGSYRPLCVATYRLNYLLGGLEPLGYHLVNVLLHGLCTGLLVRIARRLLPGQRLAQAVAGLLFAAHPVHTEAVAGVVGRADLLACLLAEAAFLAYLGYRGPEARTRPARLLRLGAALALSLLATLAKETGIASLALCLLWELSLGPRGRWPASGLLGGSLAGLALARLRLLASGRPPEFASADNPVARHPSRLARGLTFLYLPAASLGMLLCPCTLSFDWSMSAVPPVESLADPRNLHSLLLYGTLGAAGLWALRALRRQHSREQQRLKLQQQSQHAPADQVDATPKYHAESAPATYSYSCASSVSSSDCWGPQHQHHQQLLKWSSWLAQVEPEASRCPVCSARRTNHGHTDGCRAANNNNNGPVVDCHCPKQLRAARQQANKLYRPRPYTATTSTFSSTSLASTLTQKSTPGRPAGVSGAQALLQILGFLVLPFLPASNLFFYVGFVIAERILYLPSVGACLAVGAAVSGTYDLARRKACPRTARAILLLTGVLLSCMSARTIMRNNDWHNEENLYRSALRINPPKAYGNLGSVLSAQGRVEEAEMAFAEALRHRPNMADVHYNLGVLQQGRKDYEEAILSYKRAIHFRPSLAQAYVNLGATLVTLGRVAEAVHVLRTAADLDGSALKDRRAHEAARVQALLQLGSLYADEGRLHKALFSYQQALDSLPEHYPPQSVYNLLGETLSRLQRYAEAEKWFQASLASQPDHVPAHLTYGKLLARNPEQT